MSRRTPERFEGLHGATALLLGGGGVALVAAFLYLGTETVVDLPALVWALPLLTVLVFTLAARITDLSVLLAVGVASAALLELLRPVSPEVRWWAAGAGSVLLVTVTVLTYWRRRVGGEDTPHREGSPELVELDPEKQIYRRSLVDLFLQKQVAAARRGEQLTVVLFRLDDFEAFRQRHGTDVAEQLLHKMENILRSTVRDSDVVGRYGEAQFLNLLPGEDHRGGYMFAHRVRQKLSHLALEGSGGRIVDSGITVSGGIASFHEAMSTASELLAEAQVAVDAAEDQGGNRILVTRTGAMG